MSNEIKFIIHSEKCRCKEEEYDPTKDPETYMTKEELYS